ncbi:16S rRNA (guanine(1516)-N(2))-methyltransferase, partial [Enterobacter hormaechei]|nr:16S rRNA (guanine(1516)-N(2))-methyltransferase [Enterobacter hormaechei]
MGICLICEQGADNSALSQLAERWGLVHDE